MRFALLFFLFDLAACGSVTPLPAGPPPEYEPSPIYGASTASAAPTASPTPANSAGSAIAPDAGAPSPMATIDPER